MQYFIKGELIEENLAGKQLPEVEAFVKNVIHPSLRALDRTTREGRGIGGIGAGERTGYMILEAQTHEDVGKFLRSLPFWGALKWTIVPLQTYQSCIEQDVASFEQFKAMVAPQGR
jgi:hypothetical protein